MVATITNISSAKSSVKYFEKDGYYAKDDPEHKRASRWYGVGAEELGLTNQVEKDDFERIMNGEVLGTDTLLGRNLDGERKHRAGVEITFSAPKAVSIEGVVFRQEDVVKCHDDAVRLSLGLVQEELLTTRAWDPATKRMERESSPSMVAATFRHDTSRNLDPQLHTHCLIANMTKEKNGKWRSLDMGNLKREEKFIGAFYRNELARGMRELGYEITKDMVGHVPSFSIGGYEQETLDGFSTRRQDILHYLKENDMPYSTRNAQKASLATRGLKIDMSREDLDIDLGARVKEMGIEKVDRVAEREKEYEVSSLNDGFRSIEHLSEQQPVFPKNAQKAQMLGYSRGRFNYDCQCAFKSAPLWWQCACKIA